MKRLFSFIWRKWLYDERYNAQRRVVKVTGWRSAILDEPSGLRVHSTFCFWWLK